MNALQFPLALWTRAEFISNDHDEQFVFGIFFTESSSVMILYNLFIYVGIREQSYLDYVLFIGSLTLLQADINKYTYEYLWPQAPSWTIQQYTDDCLFYRRLSDAIHHWLPRKCRALSGQAIEFCSAGRLQIPGIVIPLLVPTALQPYIVLV